MRLLQFSILVISLLLLPAGPVTALVSCHCFQDRSFDPARPTAADDYFLATVQNSLMAAAFGVSRNEIVRAKMAGADADLLWVSYYLSDRAGVDLADVASLADQDERKRLLGKLDQSNLKLDARFIQELGPSFDLNALAGGAFHAVMTSELGIDESTLVRLESAGAGRQEQAMSVFLSLLLGDDPVDFYRSVSSGRASWGGFLAGTGLDPKQIESAWGKLIRLHERGL